MAPRGAAPFATFLIIGPTCFFLGILFAYLPYDYHVLWSAPEASEQLTLADAREPYFVVLENHLKFLYASPPLISRLLHLVIGVGLLGLLVKLYRASEANLLFDGASLVLYMCGIIVYIVNLVKGMRTVSAGAYYGGPSTMSTGPLAPDADANAATATVPDATAHDFIGREDSLRVMAASNTILALVLVGVLVLQAGQWYAQRKEAEEMEQMDRDEKKARETDAAAAAAVPSKKKQ